MSYARVNTVSPPSLPDRLLVGGVRSRRPRRGQERCAEPCPSAPARSAAPACDASRSRRRRDWHIGVAAAMADRTGGQRHPVPCLWPARLVPLRHRNVRHRRPRPCGRRRRSGPGLSAAPASFTAQPTARCRRRQGYCGCARRGRPGSVPSAKRRNGVINPMANGRRCFASRSGLSPYPFRTSLHGFPRTTPLPPPPTPPPPASRAVHGSIVRTAPDDRVRSLVNRVLNHGAIVRFKTGCTCRVEGRV